MAYTDVFGGNTVWPSDVSYLPLALTTSVVLEWPLEASTGDDIAARVVDVTPASANLTITMPPADQTAPGQLILFINRGPHSYEVDDNGGNTLLTITDGTSWTLLLTDNSDEAGEWYSYQQGSVLSQAQAAALAGYGLVATGATLSQEQDVTTFNSDYTASTGDRAKAYVWTGGIGTLTLTSAGTVGNGWFMSVRNEGSGNLTVDCSGADTINSEGSIVLRPYDSCTINCDGTSFYTVGLGQDPVFAFDFTSIDLTGAGATYTLSGAELNRIAYRFFGVLSNDVKVVVPATTQQYWVANDTTGGSFTVSVATATQASPLTVIRGSRGIYYCQGSEVIKADTASVATPISIADGGTGATTASGARVNLGGTSVGIAMFTAANEAAGRTAILAASSGANTFTAKQTFTGAATTLAMLIQNASEVVTISATAATGTIAYNIVTQSVLYYTSSAAANWTVNLRGDGSNSLDSLLSTGQSVTVAFLVTQGATAYYNSAVQVDGTAVGVTTRWIGGAPSAGTINSVNAYTYTILKTGAATFSVFASVSAFV